jgi:hypothetical protein
MEIPEITESQLKLLMEVCYDPAMSVFSQCNHLPTDNIEDATKNIEAQKDTQRLIELKLLREITEDHKEQIEQMGIRTGRVWHVYQLEPLGRALFQAQLTTAIQ